MSDSSSATAGRRRKGIILAYAAMVLAGVGALIAGAVAVGHVP